MSARTTLRPATSVPAGVQGPLRHIERDGALVQEFKLENGLSVLVVERHLDPVVAVMCWYRVGARDETEREAGVSHFLEHMMFKGSAGFGKGRVDEITTTLGGSNNAFTSPDHTAYWFELASDRWEAALEIEADRMQKLLLDEREFESEKAVVLEELSMGEDDPWRSLTHQVQHVVFPRHPYRRPVIGYDDTLKALRVDDMRDYYRRFYHPRNAVLVVCGDVVPENALAAIQRHFGAIHVPPASVATPVTRPKEAEPKGEQRLRTTWDDSASRLCIAWPSVSVGSDDDHTLDVIATLLTGGRLARFYRKLVVDRGLATSISTHNDARRDVGVFWLFAELAQGKQAEELERAIDAELERLAREPVPAPELARAKKTILSSEAYDSETVSDLAEEVGEFATDADWVDAFDVNRRIRAVSARQVQDTAARLLSKQRRVVGWSVPKNALKEPAKKSSQRKARAVKAAGAKKRARGVA